MNEAVREARLERLRQEVTAIGAEVSAAWSAPGMSPQEWANWQRDRKRIQEDIRTHRFQNAEAWSAMLGDTVEVRYFMAKRRYALGWYGLSEEPWLYRLTLKDQLEQFGVLIIVTFRDALAAIDPRQELDVLFAPDCAELFRAFATPAKAVAKWLAKREAEGNPYVPVRMSDDEHRYAAEGRAALTEFKALRNLRFPTKEALEAAQRSERLWAQPEEAKATLIALRARLLGGQPSVEEQLRAINPEDMTPLEALAALRRLHAQAMGG